MVWGVGRVNSWGNFPIKRRAGFQTMRSTMERGGSMRGSLLWDEVKGRHGCLREGGEEKAEADAADW